KVAASSVSLTAVFLSTVRTVLPVLGLTADKLAQELVALVAQFLMDANLGGEVALNRGLLGHGKEQFQRRLRRTLVAADIAEDGIELPGVESGERRLEPRHGLRVERGETAKPLEHAFALHLAEQEIDVVRHPRGPGARRSF